MIDAVVSAANPLIYREIINKGILANNTELVVGLAVLVAVLAIVAAALTLVERFISARVGENLIYDMRTRVFDHVQRMPIAFFTRTQTGALVSRLNNDVTGAQEAFTDVLSSVIGNLITVAIVLGRHVPAVGPRQLTLAALGLLPVFRIAGPLRSAAGCIGSLTQVSATTSPAEMNNGMVERFNVAGALLVKLFGHPRAESAAFGQKAERVRDIDIVQAIYARFFFVALMLMTSTEEINPSSFSGWAGRRNSAAGDTSTV